MHSRGKRWGIHWKDDEKDELMSFDVNPISPQKMVYINELRNRCKDLLDSYDYPDYITCNIELLRFVRGFMVIWRFHLK